MNPFNLTGWEAVITTAIICITVVYCWRLTVLDGWPLICNATITVTRYICDTITTMWSAIRTIVNEVVDKWLAGCPK